MAEHPSLDKKLEGKVAIITGGVSNICEETARQFAHHGTYAVDGGGGSFLCSLVFMAVGRGRREREKGRAECRRRERRLGCAWAKEVAVGGGRAKGEERKRSVVRGKEEEEGVG
ncbi:hypothetical protein NL676_013601 [Syzygium grande]|nr:hypothetical protein NL676_013601 [Syzygium grande]